MSHTASPRARNTGSPYEQHDRLTQHTGDKKRNQQYCQHHPGSKHTTKQCTVERQLRRMVQYSHASQEAPASPVGCIKEGVRRFDICRAPLDEPKEQTKVPTSTDPPGETRPELRTGLKLRLKGPKAPVDPAPPPKATYALLSGQECQLAALADACLSSKVDRLADTIAANPKVDLIRMEVEQTRVPTVLRLVVCNLMCAQRSPFLYTHGSRYNCTRPAARPNRIPDPPPSEIIRSRVLDALSPNDATTGQSRRVILVADHAYDLKEQMECLKSFNFSSQDLSHIVGWFVKVSLLAGSLPTSNSVVSDDDTDSLAGRNGSPEGEATAQSEDGEGTALKRMDSAYEQ